MEKKIEKFCLIHRLIHADDTIVVACSGGPDSLALLHVLVSFKEKYNVHLIACYVHHGIRPEADAEVLFVRQVAEDLGVPFEGRFVNVPELAKQRKLSEETIGRQERYAALESVADAYGAISIAVAHHQDDQAETILYHLIRGSGLSGLAGMRSRRGRIIRPFLCVDRAEIEQYVQDCGLQPCLDRTNLETIYVRNKIRLELIPKLREFNEKISAEVSHLGEIARADDDCLTAWTEDFVHRQGKRTITSYRISKLIVLQQPLAIQRRAVRCILQDLTRNPYGVSFDYVERILSLFTKSECKKFSGQGFFVWTEGAEIIFSTTPPALKLPGQEQLNAVTINGVGEYHFGSNVLSVEIILDRKAVLFDKYTALFDHQNCKFPLVLRTRRSGDTIRFGRCNIRKTIKKYCIDKRIPQSERTSLPLLCKGQDVWWIPGYERSVRSLPNKGTVQYVQMVMHESASCGENKKED